MSSLFFQDAESMGKMDSDMFQSCDELLHALVRYTEHSRRVRDGFEFFFFRIFVPGMDTVLMAVPQLVSSRVSVQVKFGEFAFQFRAYTSMQVVTSMQVIELPMTSHLN